MPAFHLRGATLAQFSGHHDPERALAQFEADTKGMRERECDSANRMQSFEFGELHKLRNKMAEATARPKFEIRL